MTTRALPALGRPNRIEQELAAEALSRRAGDEAGAALLGGRIDALAGRVTLAETNLAFDAADLAAQAQRTAALELDGAATDAALAEHASRLALLPVFVAAEAMTVAELRATFPAAAHVGRYARVTDLFGELTSTMIAEQSGAAAYWRPTRGDFTKSVAMSQLGTAPVLTALGSAPSLRITGIASGSANAQLAKDGAWPGARKTIVMAGTLNLFTWKLLGLGAGAVLSFLLGTKATLEFDGADWLQVA